MSVSPDIYADAMFTVSLVAALFIPLIRNRTYAWMTAVASSLILSVLSSLLFSSMIGRVPEPIYSSTLTLDAYGALFALILSIAAMLAIYAAGPVVEKWGTASAFYGLTMLILFGVYSIIFLSNLLVAMSAWILASVASYAMTALAKDEASAEGSVKYAVMGAASSTLLFLGIILVFAMNRGLVVSPRLVPVGMSVTFVSATIGLVVAAAGFKMGVFPFQGWLPDTYGGVHPTLIAYVSMASKAMAVLAIYRLVAPIAGNYPYEWLGLMALFAILTMTYGNLGALVQDNAQRLMAYSSIAHAGYFLVGFAGLAAISGMRPDWALMGLAMHFASYAFGKVGSFTALAAVKEKLGGVMLSDLKGLGKKMPYTAAGFTTLLFSLMGMPPIIGFWSKLYLFASVAYAAPWLALIALLNTVISVAYYAKIIKAMYFEEPETPGRIGEPPELASVVVVAAIISVVLGLGALQLMARAALP